MTMLFLFYFAKLESGSECFMGGTGALVPCVHSEC